MTERSDLAFLEKRLEKVPHQKYPSRSRIHKLKSLFTAAGETCFVKREDELGFGISGIKFRKYRTLIPYIIENEFKEALVIGGAFSNHILSIVQLLIENNIDPILLLKGPRPIKNQGNFLLTQTFLPSTSIHWIPKENWQSLAQDAFAYATQKAILIPEGATLFPAFLGALTLPLDIIRNEIESGIEFDHLFIETGTGYSAAALLLGFAFLKKRTMCHLLMLADTEQAFIQQLHKLHLEFQEWLGETFPFPIHFRCLDCSIAPSFGSTNRELFNFIVQSARIEGFLLDPIYSGKLFHQTNKILKNQPELTGNILFIHSGGALTLCGFQQQLENSL